MAWSINVNVAGVAAGGLGRAKIERGVYLAKISGSERKKSAAGNDVVIINFKITDAGPALGMEEGIALNTDLAKDGNKKNMRAFAQSMLEFMGLDAAAILEAGAITLTDEKINNAVVAVYCEPGEKDAAGNWGHDNHRFLTKAQYEQYKANGLPALVPQTAATTKKGKAAAAPEVGGNPFGAAGATAIGTQTATPAAVVQQTLVPAAAPVAAPAAAANPFA